MKKIFQLNKIFLVAEIINYNSQKFKADLMAGLSLAALSLPQNMAYALIVGVAPVYGIYATIIAMSLYVVFGSSNYMIVGPTNIMAMAMLASLQQIEQPDYLTALFLLTFLVGAFQFLFALLKLGKFVNYISHSLIVGLSTGAVIMIAVGQLSNFLGIEVKTGATFYSKLFVVLNHLPELNSKAIMIGSITAATILLLQWINHKLPAYLIGLLFATLVVYFAGLKTELAVVGSLPAEIIKFRSVAFKTTYLIELSSKAFSIAVIGLIQTLAVAKSIAITTNETARINREFRAQGLINMLGSFFSSFATAGSFAKSYTNLQVGAKSRFAQLIAAISVIVFVVLFRSVVAYIPIASLAALVIIVAVKSIDLTTIKQNLMTTRGDSIIFLVTLSATLFLTKLEDAIYLGIIVSLIVLLRESEQINLSILSYSDHGLREVKENYLDSSQQQNEYEQCIIINLAGDLNFNSADNLKKKLAICFKPGKDFIIRLRELARMDITVIKELDNFISQVNKAGGSVYFSGISKKNYQRLKNYGLIDQLKAENIYFSSERLFAATSKAYYNLLHKHK